MPGAQDGKLIIEDADLLPGSFRNFAGREGQYNREGDRNFAIRLEEDVAQAMLNDGWNVKRLKNRETGEPKAGDYYITVSVGFNNRPPLLVLISSKGRVNLGQHECDVLDWVDIKQADVVINPYKWDVQGKQGIKAYVKSLFVTLEEDYLDQKYADVPLAVSGTKEQLAIESGNSQDAAVDAAVIDVESWEE